MKLVNIDPVSLKLPQRQINVLSSTFGIFLGRFSGNDHIVSNRPQGNPDRMSFPTSATRARVGSSGSDSSVRHRPESRMPGRVRQTTLLGAPYDRPCPRAANTRTSGPHAARAADTTVRNPRVRLLAPSAITLATSAAIGWSPLKTPHAFTFKIVH
jgi:hypothetical protein